METRIGKVTHFYNRIMVAVLELSDELKVGDTVHILGHTSDFIQPVWSLEIEHRKVPSAGPGQEVALQVSEPVRRSDAVYKVFSRETPPAAG